MRIGIRSFGCAALIALGGCSIHPIPDDRTRDSTVDIAKKIRCEAKNAVMMHANDPKFDTAGIAYQFEFTITENNKASGSATFGLPFSNGKFALAIGAGEDKQRVGERTFLIVEDFKELKKEDCSVQATSRQWRYPITGIVGLEEIIDTFVKLANLDLLEKGSDKVSSFVDALEFTTTIKGNVDPSIELNPVADKFRLAEASASLSADRTDKHRLTISLSIPVSKQKAATRMGSPKERALLGLERQDIRTTNRKILDILRTAPVR